MNLIQKISPVGIDWVVNDIQEVLNDNITWTDFDCYPRIYKEEINEGVKPMLYTSNGEYQEVFNDDSLGGSCFFYEEDNRNAIDNGFFNAVRLSIVFQIDLSKQYPLIAHRADEEAHNDVLIALKTMPQHKITGLATKLTNVYSEFATTQVQFDDIERFHVFRIDLSVLIDDCCNC